MLSIIISILLLQMANIDAICSHSETHKVVSKIQECQKEELDNLIEQIEKGSDSSTAIQRAICNWHDTMVEQCFETNIQDCYDENEEKMQEETLESLVLILLNKQPGLVYRLLSNCESVKVLMTTNSATKKCNAHEMKLANDNLLACAKAQKDSWDNEKIVRKNK